ncbi:hypothetical protein MLD38_012670 [Melastoma candidum]|uniref:Uncharacterized protein n=1 Tax=Melastoma candidum TaxID=119954 RepID=A0ACB9RFH6_9MYRT|nr:hypothetical protein MLD38_012670 [Melastoma candidum]
MHVLMDMELKVDEAEDLKGTLCYMVRNRFASGNYPLSDGSKLDFLVHWCHGAPAVSLTLTKAAQDRRQEVLTSGRSLRLLPSFTRERLSSYHKGRCMAQISPSLHGHS